MQLPSDGDVAAQVLESGGVDLYLQHVIHDAKSLSGVAALAKAVEQQQESLRASRDAGAVSLRAAATQAVKDVRERLADIEKGAADTLAEFDTRRNQLREYAKAFREQSTARAEHDVVVQCRVIAEAYSDARKPLHELQTRGDRAALGDVANAITRLVGAVDAIRTAARDGKLADSEEDEQALNGIVTSLENRTIDAVIKARAAFVNILDNEFRAFGWPMNVPSPENEAHASLVATVHFFVEQLDALQNAAENQCDFIAPRTRWQASLSDSWAISCILRAPLARFKYHFLESFRHSDPSESDTTNSNGTTALTGGDLQKHTSRFDRPEWAADFAVERIQEASPFLRSISQSAELKFMKGFCRVFADKIAYDCELAMRSSKNDSDADSLISHAADIARQFDVKLRADAIEGRRRRDKTNHIEPNGNGNTYPEKDEEPFPSALSFLSANAVFFTAWASSELRLAETQVGNRLDKILAHSEKSASVRPNGAPNTKNVSSAMSELDVEAECGELVQMIGEAGKGCRHLNTPTLVHDFLRLTELPLLQNLRGRLRQPFDDCDWAPATHREVYTCARAGWCARVLAELLEDRVFVPFYAQFEAQGFALYRDDVERLKSFTGRASSCISEAVVDCFCAALKDDYGRLVRFGELASQDAAVVLAHDLSESLCIPMTRLAEHLAAIVAGCASRKVSSQIWRDVATRIDAHFFETVILQAFSGGITIPAASTNNAYMRERTSAKMTRQLAHDASALVAVFETVSSAPGNFLPRCSQAHPVMKVAAGRVMRPNIPPKQGQEECVRAVLKVAKAGDADRDEVENNARRALDEIFSVRDITPRECLELFAIAGLKKAIPLG